VRCGQSKKRQAHQKLDGSQTWFRRSTDTADTMETIRIPERTWMKASFDHKEGRRVISKQVDSKGKWTWSVFVNKAIADYTQQRDQAWALDPRLLQIGQYSCMLLVNEREHLPRAQFSYKFTNNAGSMMTHMTSARSLLRRAASWQSMSAAGQAGGYNFSSNL
jgi:hypothetical protein